MGFNSIKNQVRNFWDNYIKIKKKYANSILLLSLFSILISCQNKIQKDAILSPEIIKFFEAKNETKKFASKEKLKILSDALNYSSLQQNDSLYLTIIDQFLIFYKDSPSRKIEFSQKGLAVAEKINDTGRILKYIDILRNSYLRIKEYPLALKYSKRHLDINYKIGTIKDQLLSINYLGIYHNDKNEYDSALVYYDLMHSLNKNPPDSTILNVYWINSAIIYEKKKKFDLAIKNFSKALIFNDGYKDKSAYVQHELSKVYFEKGDFNQALIFCKNAEKSAEKLNNSLKIAIDKTLYEIYQKKNDLRNENLYFTKFTKAKIHEDSIRIERSNELLDLDYKAQKQEISLLELNQKVISEKYNNKILIISVISIGLILLSLLVLIRYLRKSKQQINSQKKEIEKLNQNLENKVALRTAELSTANAELIKKNFEITEALFKGQTIERKRVAAELHDNLGSTLSALKWRLGALNSDALSPKEKEIYEGIKTMMGTAYEEVRHISHNLLPAEFEKFGLVGALEKLINEINENGKIHFEFIVNGDFKNLDKKIALELYSTSLELVNNTLKHSKATKGLLQLENFKGHLNLKVCDNSIGMQAGDKTGKGLNGIKERLESLGGVIKINNEKDWNLILDIKILLNQTVVVI